MFKSNWYDQSQKFKKMFLFFSQANTPPVKIKTYGLIITLEVFINVRTMFEVGILRNMNWPLLLSDPTSLLQLLYIVKPDEGIG